MRLVVLGPPGAGKGTQAARVAEKLDIAHIATGDMFRHAVEAATPLGLKVKEVMERGELVGDELTNEVMRERLDQPDTKNGFVLDGYPRNLDQAQALDKMLADKGINLNGVIKFMVKGPNIVERLAGRRVCPVCKAVYHFASHPPKYDEVCDNDGTKLVRREDDQPETILRRLEVYGEQTRPLFDFYGDKGILYHLDALGSTDEVFQRLMELVLGLPG
jgi:adenylate kinase